MWTLISATPSPYARKVRIALAEKGLPFTLQTEVPWNSTTQTPQYNPLEKLPVLILDDGKTAVYESHYIMEWLEAKYPKTSLMPESVDGKLFAKQVEVIADGICDALVLAFFEGMRGESQQSGPWKDRYALYVEKLRQVVFADGYSSQMRKAEGGLQALAEFVDQAGDSEFLIDNKLTLADIAIASMLGWLQCRWPTQGWQQKHPRLEQYFQRLDQRKSFAETRPSAQTITDKVV